MIKRFFQSVRRRFRVDVPQKVNVPEASAEAQPKKSGDVAAAYGVDQAAEQQSEVKKHKDQTLEIQETSAAQNERPKKRKWQLHDFEVDPVPGKVRFHDIGLPLPVMHAIADSDFQYCTPVQAEALPHLLEGKDLVGHANTGTGKSAVFLITILTRLYNERQKKDGAVKALIIAPTRELVIQITKDARTLGKYCNIRIAPVYGGTDYKKQMDFVENNRCDIVVATPGRLLDFCGKKIINLSRCSTLVIDEADRMLDMGFIPDVRRIVGQLPEKKDRQTLLFSATITDEVKRLAYQWCTKPVNVAIEPEQVAVESVDQKVYLVTSDEKYAVLYNLLQQNKGARIAVFANQKIEARRLYERLQRNSIECTLLSGDVPQEKRTKRLESFRSGRIPVLVATDVAGRGIHIEGITHVINYTLPYEPEDYVHRIGRTGRAGAEGISVSFACEEESFVLPEIEEFIGRKLDCSQPDEELLIPPPKGRAPEKKKTQSSTGGTGGKGGRSGSRSSGRQRKRRPSSSRPPAKSSS